MSVTTVGDLLRRARRILQEESTDGTRWTNAELLDWLNESYAFVVGVRPGANVITAEIVCVAGTRQAIPAAGERLLDVVRNTAPGANGLAVTPMLRSQLNAARPRWHGEPKTDAIEHFLFDEDDPRSFFVYPPAMAGAKLEISFSAVPAPHGAAQAKADSTEALRLPDTYAPILVDLVLARAFAKDAEGGANQQRATLHSQAAQGALGLKIQGDSTSSPNAEAGAQ